MKMHIRYALVLCIHTSLLFSMDVDTPSTVYIQANKEATFFNPELHCLRIKTKDAETPVAIPKQFNEFFKDKIEIAQTLNPESMVYIAHDVLHTDLVEILKVLEPLYRNESETIYDMFRSLSPEKLVHQANIIDSLNLRDLKKIITHTIQNTLNDALEVEEDCTVTLRFIQQFENLKECYLTDIKTNMKTHFMYGIMVLRNQSIVRKKQKQIITTLPLTQGNTVQISPNGSYVAWIDTNNTVHWYDSRTNRRKSLNPTESTFTTNVYTHFTLNKTGARVALWEEHGPHLLLWNTETDVLTNFLLDFNIDTVTDNCTDFLEPYLITGTVPALLYTEHGKRVHTLAKPTQDSVIISCNVSIDGALTYVIYKNSDDEYTLSVYSSLHGEPLFTEKIDPAYHIYPGKEPDSIWLGSCPANLLKLIKNF